MTSPKLENEAIRLGILAPKQNPYAWLNEPIYEPAPLPSRTVHRRRVRQVFWLLALLAIICGGLFGWNH